MRAQYDRGLQWARRNTLFLWLTIGIILWLTIGMILLILGLVQSFYSGVYIHTPIDYQWRCSDSRQCLVTIHNPGGGFDHGFNPAFHWAITGDPSASLHFSSTSGILQAHQSIQIHMVVAPGSCPNSITITSKNDIFNFSPFVYDPLTNHCTLDTPSYSST